MIQIENLVFLIYEIGSFSFVPVIFKKSQVALSQHYFPIAGIRTIFVSFSASSIMTYLASIYIFTILHSEYSDQKI